MVFDLIPKGNLFVQMKYKFYILFVDLVSEFISIFNFELYIKIHWFYWIHFGVN